MPTLQSEVTHPWPMRSKAAEELLGDKNSRWSCRSSLVRNRACRSKIGRSQLLYKCCTNGLRNAPKHPKTLCYNPYCTTTYAKLGRFVIGRSAVQVRSSAPAFQSLTCPFTAPSIHGDLDCALRCRGSARNRWRASRTTARTRHWTADSHLLPPIVTFL